MLKLLLGGQMSESYSYQQALPRVTKDVLDAVDHDLSTDTTYNDRTFTYHNNHNSALMRHIVATAHAQSTGEMELQASFISGARYVLAALQRQIDTHTLAALFENHDFSEQAPEITVELSE